MIFHENIFDGHHMMNWDLGNWFFMIFGWGIIISAILVILYMIIQSSTKNQHNKIVSEKIDNVGVYNKPDVNRVSEDTSELINFCYNCGERLIGDSTQFCPRCGVKLTK
jgi:uncharacterized paraquat-inducible protein A